MVEEKLGDYTIVKSLGKGGFGSVYEAISAHDETVAIKVLNPQVLENKRSSENFSTKP